MAIGPAQLTLPGINHDEIHGEPERLRESETVRALGALVAYNDAGRRVRVEHLGQLSEEEAIEVSIQIWALVGRGIELEAGTGAGAEAVTASAASDVVQMRRRAGLGCARGDPQHLPRGSDADRAWVGGGARRRDSRAPATAAAVTVS